MTEEFRAVFGSPFNTHTSLGKTRDSLKEALADRPERSEETFETLIGVQQRKVEPWAPIPLSVLVAEMEKK